MRRSPALALGLGILLALAGCARERAPETGTLPLPVQVLADTSNRISLSAAPPATARIWIERVAPASRARVASVEPAPPSGGGPALPEAELDSVTDVAEAPSLEIDSDLKPPIPRRTARLVVPDAWRARRTQPQSVELDLLIEESGEVSEVEWAGGSADTALVDEATRSARAMSFYPALRRGQPIAVWCRQRFDFTR